MMADVRLIDAVAYCKELKEEMDYPGRSEEFMIAIDVAIADLADAPTIDAVPVVHGRWVGTQYDGYADGFPVYDLWGCSECREEYESEGDPPPYNYCPNCGAKMDLEVLDGQA